MKFLFILFILINISQLIIAQDTEFADSIPMNQIKVLGSHNSYRRITDPGILKTIHLVDPFYKHTLSPAMRLEYDHISIDSQLEVFGLRSFELDIYNDPIGGRYYNRQGNALRAKATSSNIPALLQPGMKVMHIADIDYNTNYYTFKEAIYKIKNWSLLHPTHLPIYVIVELKEDGIGDRLKLAGFKSTIKFDINAIIALKNEIEEVFSPILSQIVYPDFIRKDYHSLREAIIDSGYPLLSEVRGKIIFILMTNQSLNKELCNTFPSYRTLPFFTFTTPSNEEAVFIKYDNPILDFDKIKTLVKAGYIVRTRSDVETEEARNNDYSMFYLANESSAQIISTDYYQPYKKTGFVLSRKMLIQNIK